jgi:hypothetical protein
MPPPSRSGPGSSRWAGAVAVGIPGTCWTTPAGQAPPKSTPEWQNLAVGDQLQFWALGRVMDAYRVAVIEPNSFLGLYGYTDLRGRWLDPTQPRPSSYMEALWGFLLNELPDRRTRLVISGYQTFRPRWVERFASWLLIAVSWPMQARMLAVLKRNIERAAPTGATTVPGRAAP